MATILASSARVRFMDASGVVTELALVDDVVIDPPMPAFVNEEPIRFSANFTPTDDPAVIARLLREGSAWAPRPMPDMSLRFDAGGGDPALKVHLGAPTRMRRSGNRLRISFGPWSPQSAQARVAGRRRLRRAKHGWR